MVESKKKISANESALRMLTRRVHARYELEQKLIQKGYSEQDVSQAIDYVDHYNYLNDEEYVRQLCLDVSRNGKGKFWLRQKLQQVKIDSSISEPIIEEILPDQGELPRLVQYLSQRGKIPIEKEDKKAYARLYRFLQSRGVDSDVVHKIMQSATDRE